MFLPGRSGCGALALVAVLWVVAARAQHTGHRMPGQPATGAGEAVPSVCRQQALQALAAIDRIAARLEAARQVNSGPEMRAAMDALQTALGELREFAAACAGGAQGDPHARHATAPDATPAAPAAGAAPSGAGQPAHRTPQGATADSGLTITVTDAGFEPARVTVKRGKLVRLTFVRRWEKACGDEVVFPGLGIRRALPLGEPVVVEFTPARSGEITFTCGMNMLAGAVLVR